MGALFIPTVLQIVIILGSSLISSFGYFRIIRTKFLHKDLHWHLVALHGPASVGRHGVLLRGKVRETVNESKLATFNLLEQQMVPELSV